MTVAVAAVVLPRLSARPPAFLFLQLLADGPFLFVRLFPTSGALDIAVDDGSRRPPLPIAPKIK